MYILLLVRQLNACIAVELGGTYVLLGFEPKLVTCVSAARGIKGEAWVPDR